MFSTHDQKPNVSPSFGTSKGVAGSTLDIVSARVTRCVAGGHPVAMMHQLFKKKKTCHICPQWIGFWEILQENPICNGKITLVSCKFSLKPIH